MGHEVGEWSTLLQENHRMDRGNDSKLWCEQKVVL